jgi:drug/metabolite transporter (DMT)-like permease
VGIALGLGAALSWGTADYFVALAARSIGALRVALGFHLAALIPLTGLVLATDALARLTWSEVPAFVLLGAVGWLSYLAFYRALAIGPISLVSPIVSGYAAVTVTLAVLIVGERTSAVETAAVIVTIVGVILASADLPGISSATFDRRATVGLALAIVAMVLFGGFLFGVSYYHRRLGWLAPIFLARGFTTLFLLAHASRGGKWRWADPSRTLIALIALIAALDTGGYVVFNVALSHAETPIVATASAPYAVVPILMGVYLLRERPNRTQWLGIAVLSGGLILLGVGA